FFFFQAEDGIRDLIVTGVQTCALPILKRAHAAIENGCDGLIASGDAIALFRSAYPKSTGVVIVSPGIRPAGASTDDHKRFTTPRSEERRVGKECRSRWAGDKIRKRRKR